jgi:hypothetical protein
MDGGSARRKATYTQNNTDTKDTHTDIHASSGFEPTITALERAKTVHALDRSSTVIIFTSILGILHST